MNKSWVTPGKNGYTSGGPSAGSDPRPANSDDQGFVGVGLGKVKVEPGNQGGAGEANFVPWMDSNSPRTSQLHAPPFAGLGYWWNSSNLAPYLNNIRLQLLAQGYFLPWLQARR